MKIAAVLGVGPGLGVAAARRFARAGYTVGLLARKLDGLTAIQAEIAGAGGTALSLACDASDPESVSAAFAALRERAGNPEVLVYNVGAFAMGGILELTPAQFESAWRANCFGGFLAAQEVVPAMLSRGRGTLIFTGATAALRGSARFAGLAVGKFGLRALAQSLARELGPRGIHVAHVIIDGGIATPAYLAQAAAGNARASRPGLAPEAIAESYYQLTQQHESAWTHELDLRPAGEPF